jgi:tetraacyldisaccharide 4'-kinase
MKYRDIEAHCAAIIEGRKPAGVLKPLLRVASIGYRAGLSLHTLSKKIFKRPSEKVNAVVVSVGNIAVGGTGKTPIVRALAQEMSKVVPTAILIRGYRSQIEKEASFLRLRWGEGLRSSAEVAGDEAILLAQGAPDCDVWVGSDRLANAHRAVAQGARFLILDDGMQYSPLKKDFEIAVVDCAEPLGRGLFLPEGPLRAFPKSLARADLVIAQRASHVSHVEGVERQLGKYTPAPVIGGNIASEDGSWRGKKVGVVCAIGNPQRFIETLENAGCVIADALFLRDHSYFEEDVLKEFAQRCAEHGAEHLICTEKDFVKISCLMDIPIPLCPIKVEWEPTVHIEIWKNFIHKVKSKIEEINERRI